MSVSCVATERFELETRKKCVNANCKKTVARRHGFRDQNTYMEETVLSVRISLIDRATSEIGKETVVSNRALPVRAKKIIQFKHLLPGVLLRTSTM